jgi:transposase InsO family protein
MIAFIDAHRGDYGVEPICRLLPIAPSTYYEHKARERDPARCPARVKRDAQVSPEIVRVHRENREVYGVRKVWKQLHREDIDVARCTVERLMKQLGLRGTTRGDHKCKTTLPDALQAKPKDLVSLNEHWFVNLAHGRAEIETWRREYNDERPKKGLGGLTPSQYAKQLAKKSDRLSARSLNQGATQ